MKTKRKDPHDPESVSRREFLKAAAVIGAAGLLTGCRPAAAPAATPTGTPPPTPTASRPRWQDVARHFPETPTSRLVRTRHAKAWDGDRLVPDALQKMLDDSIARLTRLDDAREAWAALFRPQERVAIKVNTYGGSTSGSVVFTHPALTAAVVQALQEAGIPAGQIFIYDLNTADMEGAGYAINRDGSGARCFGIGESWEALDQGKGDYQTGWRLTGLDLSLGKVLLDCDALINMPVLKTHSWSGLTFAMKNHFGSINSASRFHEAIPRALPELNALAPIRDRARLYIGDLLETACLQGAWGYGDSDWSLAQRGDTLLMSFDPVALDTVGLREACAVAESNNESTDWINGRAGRWLAGASGMLLGTSDPETIEEIELVSA